ncbi:hypothetical protein [Streptomyces aureus]|uniref:hypothetical protein n=1 Tax=Streptomyces aureus TaxID=193461 RepID=UPI000560E7AC|nr:hypothetical protein [Streptomyces aureus]
MGRRLNERLAAKDRAIEVLIAERDSEQKTATACTRQMRRAYEDLSRAKDVVAEHIDRVGRPDTDLTDVPGFALSLQQALAAAGVDLRLELGRLQGARL